MNTLLLIVLVAIAVLSQALAKKHASKKAHSEGLKTATAIVDKFQKALAPYKSKGSASQKSAVAPKGKKLSVKSTTDIQSGWVEMRMRTKAGCKGKVPMVMGVRLGCNQMTVYPTNGVPFTGSINVNADSDATNIYAHLNYHSEPTCNPEFAMNTTTMVMPRCETGRSSYMGARLNRNVTKDFTNYNGIVKLGYTSQMACMSNSSSPIAYQMYREDECMPGDSEGSSRFSSKFTSCSIGMNGPEMGFQVYKGLKCKSGSGKNRGLLSEDTLGWSDLFGDTSNAPFNSCSPASSDDIPLANFVRYACVQDGQLMVGSML